MRNLASRLEKLESSWHGAKVPSQIIRIVVSNYAGSLNLAKSKCQRTLSPNGLLMEIVNFDGNTDELKEQELAQFVECFPVQSTVK
jgi:hypothetical protein